jgi:prepilin-type N-terminal cleavage/methylation domain-containing protein
MPKLHKGFTLIELLIVIAVLGILAVAVLSAINPIEQINRSRDTGSRSDAEQLLSAMDRYYATNGYYPWESSAETTGIEQLWEAVSATTPIDDAAPAVPLLTKLSETGTAELKTSFTDRISKASYNTLYIYNSGAQGASTYVCFNPKSSSFKKEAETRCGNNGDGLPDDLSGAATDVCAGGATPPAFYSCLP